MTTRHILALMRKDLRIHWKGVAAAHAGALAITTTGIALGNPQENGALPAFVSNVNFLAALLWGEWFVSREKTKGSLAWLRTLPISAAALCLSKFAVCGLAVASLWTLTSLVFLRDEFLPDAPAVWAVELLGLLLFSATVVASRMLFRQKLGQTLPLLLVLPIVLIALLAERSGSLDAALALWRTPAGKAAAALVLAAAFGGVCALTVRLVASAETRRLVE